MSSNLKRRGSTWYVRVGINPKHWETIGKREIVRSLKTSDRRVAERIKHAAIADIKRWVDAAVADAGAQPQEPEWLLNVARELRLQVANGELEPTEAMELIEVMREQHFTKAGLPDTAAPSYVKAAVAMVADESYLPLSEAVSDYLKAVKGDVAESTYKSKDQRLSDFTKWAGDIAVHDVTRKLASQYVADVLAVSGASPTTNKNIVNGTLSPFYRWCIKRGLYEAANPFADQSDAFGRSTKGTADTSYRAWTPAELRTLLEKLDAARPGTTLAKAGDVARISLHTGLRLNEVCGLKLEEVNTEEWFLSITTGKTQSSIRQVPIPRRLRPLITELIGDRTEGYLIDGLKRGGSDSKRGHTLGNRFSAFKREAFPEAGRELAFHGLRSTYITAAEAAGLPVSTTELLVGHSRQSLSYGLYSKGPGLDKLAEAAEQIDLPI